LTKVSNIVARFSGVSRIGSWRSTKVLTVVAGFFGASRVGFLGVLALPHWKYQRYQPTSKERAIELKYTYLKDQF
jgi:hypothetical protein